MSNSYGWSKGLNSFIDDRIKSKYKDYELCENSKIHRGTLRKKIINENIIEYVCEQCGLEDIWNSKKIVLELDHINGVSDDNRIENLRFLCPNCHSQTPTFKGRNKEKSKKEIKEAKEKRKKERVTKKKKCDNCDDLCTYTAKYCRECYKLKQRKCERPSIEKLKEQVSEIGYVQTGKLYGVSDNTIRKWLK